MPRSSLDIFSEVVQAEKRKTTEMAGNIVFIGCSIYHKRWQAGKAFLELESGVTRSPPRNCSHEAFPFVKAPAKTKFAGSIETHPGGHFAALSAFRIVDVPIMAARNKYVRREWVVFSFHCRKLGLDITYRRSKSFQCILKACRTHDCSTEHIGC